MNSVEEKLGRRIARQRRAIGLTQAELAERVGVQPETISRLETGQRGASLNLVADISAALTLELHELFRLPDPDNERAIAIERLVWFASRLTVAEIEMVLDVANAVVSTLKRSADGDR